MEELKLLFIKQYGFEKGTRMAMVMLPNIFADFNQMIAKSFVGLLVSEEYIFEDRSGSIWLYGVKEADGTCHIQKAKMNGIVVELG